MEKDVIAEHNDEPKVLYQWSARKLQPVVLAYVAAVFLGFIALSFFVFHSMTAVKVLAMTAVAAIVPLVPSVIMRIEYRITERGLDRRTLNRDEPQEYERVFRFDELSHVVSMKFGFKFYLPLKASNPLRRFWMAHVSDEFSGEVHVEPEDRETVRNILAEQGIPIR